MGALKKIFIISSIILFLILVFLGIYNLAFREDVPDRQEGSTIGETTSTGNSPSDISTINKDQGKISALTDAAVLSPTLGAGGDHILYYLKDNGNVYEITTKGKQKKIISEDNLNGLKNVLWSSGKDKVISVFESEGENNFYMYDYDKKEGTKLRDGIDNISWANSGDRILYKYYDSSSDERSINIADPDGGNWKKLADVSYRYVKIGSIPQTSLVSFWNHPDSFEETQLQTVGITGGESKTIFSGRFGADYKWSRDGTRALVSSAEERGSSKIILATINSNGGEYQSLNIPTFVSKCVWSKDNKTIYYALPGSISEGSVMPNDYLSGRITTRDTFWKLDITTGKQDRVVELEEMKGSYDADNLFLDSSESALFFVNRLDGKLHRIEL